MSSSNVVSRDALGFSVRLRTFVEPPARRKSRAPSAPYGGSIPLSGRWKVSDRAIPSRAKRCCAHLTDPEYQLTVRREKGRPSSAPKMQIRVAYRDRRRSGKNLLQERRWRPYGELFLHSRGKSRKRIAGLFVQPRCAREIDEGLVDRHRLDERREVSISARTRVRRGIFCHVRRTMLAWGHKGALEHGHRDSTRRCVRHSRR